MKAMMFFLITFVVVMLSGCGYTTHSILPGGEPLLYVENFANKIEVTHEISNDETYYAYVPSLESDITREVIDEFIFDGHYKITNAENARFLLKGELVDFRRDPLRYDAQDNVTEYRISIVVNIEFYDAKKGELIWREKNFAGESTYRTRGQYATAEDTAIEEALDDLAVRIVERTVEDW